MKDFNENILSGDGVMGNAVLFQVFFFKKTPISFLKLVFW